MDDKPISVRLGARRMDALGRYLAAHPGENRNGVIAGAVEQYLKETGFWEDELPLDSRLDHPEDGKRPTLSERVKRLEAIVVTHGHEDHVGAVPYLLEACPGTPVYAPPYALGVLRERLAQHPSGSAKSELHAIRPKDRIPLG